MAKGKRKVEYVAVARLAQPGDSMRPRTLLPPLPVRHVVTVENARGDTVDFGLFDSAQDANRFARDRAARSGRKRVARVEPLLVDPSAAARRRPPVAADPPPPVGDAPFPAAKWCNRVGPEPMRSAERERWVALRERLQRARSA